MLDVLRIGALVSGGGTNLQAIIDAIKSGYIKNTEIAAVVSGKEDAYALTRARENEIDSKCILKRDFKEKGENAYEKAIIDYFEEKNVGLVLTAGFNTILNSYFTDYYKNKIMNVHPTLIPAFCGKGYYGLKTHEAVLAMGVKITGATVHFVTDVCDGGPIILQKCVPVVPGDTPETLQKRVMTESEQVIFPEAVKLFAEGRLVVADNKVSIL